MQTQGRNRRLYKKRRNRKWRNKFYRKGTKNQPKALVLRSPTIVPDRMFTKLRYTDYLAGRGNSGVAGCAWRYKMNSVYDPNPELGSGSVPGLTEWAAFYGQYRVHAFHIKATMANNTTTVKVWSAAPSVEDKGANYITNVWGDMPYARHGVMGGASASFAYINQYVNIGKFVGNTKQVETDPNYQASTTSNPNTLMYYNIQFLPSTTGTNFVASEIATDIVLTFYVEFFQRKSNFT